MRVRVWAALLLVALLCTIAGCGQEAAEVSALPSVARGLAAEAAALVRDLTAGEYKQVLSAYDLADELAAALSASALRRSMRELAEAYGTPLSVERVDELARGAGVDCYVTVLYERGELVYLVGFNAEGCVAVLTPEPEFDAAILLQPPARELPEGAMQAESIAGSPQRAGALVQPAGGSHTVVLLLGPADRDRDGGFGGTLPLRDIAYDLAARGIASLRLDGVMLTRTEAPSEEAEAAELLTLLQELLAHREGFDAVLLVTPNAAPALAALERLELPAGHCYEFDLTRLPDGRTPELADEAIAEEIAQLAEELIS